MTEQTKKNLRVFCLCGQKMQVTAEMYGKPAKCVACHQKWFIPDKSEISTDTGSISLKEHPELLRMPGQFSRSLDGIGENAGEMKRYFKSTPQPITEIDIGACLEKKKITDSDNQEDIKEEEEGLLSDVDDSKSSENSAPPDVVLRKIQKIPLEPLEPLRELFSYQAELTRRKEALGSNDDEKNNNGLDNYEKALSYTLNRLYAFLRHEQKSTSKQLAVLEEEIARLNVALRIGDCSVSIYLSQTDDLRRSRESLVRQNHNLIAWQEVKEPAIAGDITPISLESFDEESFEIYIPAARQIDTEAPLFVIYGDELRRLFEVRAALERRQSEWRRMEAENDFSAASVQDGLVETEAALSRNMASIRFCQQRIEQIVIDCDSDLKAIGKYKEDVFERAAKKQLREDNFQELIASIENAEENILRIRGLARQASSANSPLEVPKPTTTLLQRLRGAIGTHTYSTDSTFFIVAALFTILGLLMFTDSASTGTDWLAVVSTCIAVAIATLGIIIDRNMRGPIITCLWGLLLIFMVIFVYQRTAMDKYLVFWNNSDSFPVPLLNIRGWLIVLGASFAGTGTGIALINYKHKSKVSLWNMTEIIVIFTIVSGGAVAATHTIAPRTAPLVIELPRNTATDEDLIISAHNSADYSKNTTEDNEIPSLTSDNASGQDTNSSINNANPVLFLMQGVIHSQGSEPLFKANISYPDGSVKDVSLKLGDVILGDWKAKEYNQYTKKLTISNGDRLLILEAGRQVPLLLNPQEAS